MRVVCATFIINIQVTFQSPAVIKLLFKDFSQLSLCFSTFTSVWVPFWCQCAVADVELLSGAFSKNETKNKH